MVDQLVFSLICINKPVLCCEVQMHLSVNEGFMVIWFPKSAFYKISQPCMQCKLTKPINATPNWFLIWSWYDTYKHKMLVFYHDQGLAFVENDIKNQNLQ